MSEFDILYLFSIVYLLMPCTAGKQSGTKYIIHKYDDIWHKLNREMKIISPSGKERLCLSMLFFSHPDATQSGWEKRKNPSVLSVSPWWNNITYSCGEPTKYLAEHLVFSAYWKPSRVAGFCFPVSQRKAKNNDKLSAPSASLRWNNITAEGDCEIVPERKPWRRWRDMVKPRLSGSTFKACPPLEGSRLKTPK